MKNKRRRKNVGNKLEVEKEEVAQTLWKKTLKVDCVKGSRYDWVEYKKL